MSLSPRSLLLLSVALALGCDKSGSDASLPPEPVFDTQPPPPDDEPPVFSEFGDGVARGMVRLKEGSSEAPEGSKLEIRAMVGEGSQGSNWADKMEIPVSGPGPWAFEMKVDTTGFTPSTQVGLSFMLTVPPDYEVWWSNRDAVQAFKAGESEKLLDVVLTPLNPTAGPAE